MVKNLPAGDASLTSGWRSLTGEGNDNALQFSCLGNAMYRGAWQATVHRVTRVRHNLVTKPPPVHDNVKLICIH